MNTKTEFQVWTQACCIRTESEPPVLLPKLQKSNYKEINKSTGCVRNRFWCEVTNNKQINMFWFEELRIKKQTINKSAFKPSNNEQIGLQTINKTKLTSDLKLFWFWPSRHLTGCVRESSSDFDLEGRRSIEISPSQINSNLKIISWFSAM